jgi:acyl dehydratase
MAEESIIPEELKDMLGIPEEPRVWEIEKGHIRRYAEAVGDPNPLWQDEAYARKSRYGSIIAPPLFHEEQTMVGFVDKVLAVFEEIKYPLTGFFNASSEFEYYGPTMPGDVITSVAKLVDLYEKQGKKGKMLFFVCEASATNQRGELVSIARESFVKL